MALVSPLDPAECSGRIERAMDGPRQFGGKRAVVGRVSGSSLWMHKRIGYRNSFQIELRAELVAANGRTHILCRFGMHPLVVVFMAGWLGLVGLAGIAFVGSGIADLVQNGRSNLRDDVLEIAIPCAMLGGGVGMILLGRAVSGGDRRFLLDFLRRTAAAEPLEPLP